MKRVGGILWTIAIVFSVVTLLVAFILSAKSETEQRKLCQNTQEQAVIEECEREGYLRRNNL